VAGLQWIYDHRAEYNIRVVNLSLNSTVAESYLTNPLDAAVEILWFNGIAVVVSSGNSGANAVYPPANDPFVITVGAVDDKGTSSISDDVIASFSAYGVSDGFNKPDLVAPGKNIIGLLSSDDNDLAGNHPANKVDGPDGSRYFRMSGTSMAAPMVSGAVALLLQDESNLNPDQVKYRLKATANNSWAGYNANKAGAGYLDIYAAVNATTTQTANTGITASQLLWTGSTPVNWGSVQWGSVQWGSVQWGSVQWGSVQWGSVQWGSDYWEP
jgi:serine protease AprX